MCSEFERIRRNAWRIVEFNDASGCFAPTFNFFEAPPPNVDWEIMDGLASTDFEGWTLIEVDEVVDIGVPNSEDGLTTPVGVCALGVRGVRWNKEQS